VRLLVAVAIVADAVVLGGAAAVLAAQAQATHAAQVASAERRAALHLAAVKTARGAANGLQDPSTPAPAQRSTATPVRILIPAISVDANLQHLHRDVKGVLQPPDVWADAGWYAEGVVPGDTGPAVIAGHLDTTKRAAVFVALRQLRPGDLVKVRMSDQRTVTFRVTASRVVQKALFPTTEVYGPTPDAELRLITCSQPFDEVHGVYADNLVVFATRV
jgi:LPXTG-site transpeptidase (sortase) family protein